MIDIEEEYTIQFHREEIISKEQHIAVLEIL